MECRYHVWAGERCTKLFCNLHPKPKTVYELKVALKKILDNFLQVQLIKLFRVLQIGTVSSIKNFRVEGEGGHCPMRTKAYKGGRILANADVCNVCSSVRYLVTKIWR